MIRRSRALLQAIATECRQRGTKLCILVVGPVAPYYSAKDGKSPLGQIIANWQIDVPVIDIAIVAQATPMPWLLLFYAQWAFAEQARTRVRRRWSYPSASNRIVPVQHSEQIGEGIRVKDSVTMVIEADKAALGGSRTLSGQHPRIPAGTSPEASPAGSGFPPAPNSCPATTTSPAFPSRLTMIGQSRR